MAVLEKERWKRPRSGGDWIFLELGNKGVIP
jgi:hypothetical protein